MNDTIKVEKRYNTVFVAHRGVSGLETENTQAAFVAAGNRSYFGVETDIWHTKDGKFICNHDGRSGRICDTDLKVEESTFDDLRALVLNDKDGKPRWDLRLPTPSEYRRICEKYGKNCVPELKSDFTLEEIKEILQIFDGYLDHTCFIAFNIHNLELVKEVRPEQACEWLCTSFEPEFPEMLAKKGMGVDMNRFVVTEEVLKAYREAGVRTNVWTVDKPEEAEMFASWGIDEITTNILE